MKELISSPVFLQILFSLVAIFVTYLITFILIKIINRCFGSAKFGQKAAISGLSD